MFILKWVPSLSFLSRLEKDHIAFREKWKAKLFVKAFYRQGQQILMQILQSVHSPNILSFS
jgi:hypothetical protein